MKNATPSTHLLLGDELRALRRLQRESPPSLFGFVSERGMPFTTAGFARMIERAARRGLGLALKAHPHMLRHACGYALANKGKTLGQSRDGWGTGLSRRRRSVRPWHRTGLGISGVKESCIAAQAASYRPYRYHAMASRPDPIITVKVAAAASVNSQSIAFHSHGLTTASVWQDESPSMRPGLSCGFVRRVDGGRYGRSANK